MGLENNRRPSKLFHGDISRLATPLIWQVPSAKRVVHDEIDLDLALVCPMEKVLKLLRPIDQNT